MRGPWVMLAAGLLVLAAFVAHQRRRERRDASALLPMRLFANRGYSAGLVVQAVFQFSLAGFALALTIYLQTGLGFSPIASGLTFVPYSLGAFVGTAIAVPLGVKLGKVVPVAGAACQALGLWWAVRVMDTQGLTLSGWDIALGLVLGGIGLGLIVVPLVDIALATVSPDDAGAASGAYGTLQQVGAALGVAVVGVVFFGVVGTNFTPSVLESAMVRASWVPVLGFVACGLAALLLPSRAQVHAHVAQHASHVSTTDRSDSRETAGI